MTIAELKTYALNHRDEIEPLRELYRRRTPDEEAIWFKLPTTVEEEQHQLEQFKRMIDEQESAH